MSANKVKIRNRADLEATFKRYRVKTSSWGKVGPTKSVDRLFREICVHRESELFLVGEKRLERRVLRAQALVLYTDQEGRTWRLRERQVYCNGSEVLGRSDVSVSEKLHENETFLAAIVRCFSEELDIPNAEASWFVFARTARRYSKSAKSYPGLSSRCRARHYVCVLPGRFYKSEYIERQTNKTIYFTWEPYEGPQK